MEGKILKEEDGNVWQLLNMRTGNLWKLENPKKKMTSFFTPLNLQGVPGVRLDSYIANFSTLLLTKSKQKLWKRNIFVKDTQFH